MASGNDGTSDAPVNAAVRENLLRFYIGLVLVLSAVAWLPYLIHPSVQAYPLFLRQARFSDLTDYVGKMNHLYEGAVPLGRGFPVFNYPAPAAFVYKFFLSIRHSGYVSGLVVYSFFVAEIVLVAHLLAKKAKLNSLAVIFLLSVLFSYPMMFTLDRGNIEGVAWICTSLCLISFLARRYKTSAILLGLACCIKPFPVIYFLLFAGQRKFREIVLGLAVTIVVTVASLATLGPGVIGAYRALQPGFRIYYDTYVQNVLSPSETRFEHSMLDSMKTIRTHHAIPETLEERVAVTKPIILADTILLCLLGILMFFKLMRMSVINQIFGVCIGGALFPPVAADYSLCHLYVPLGLMVILLCSDIDLAEVKLTPQKLICFIVPLAILMCPLPELHSLQGVARCLMLLILTAATLFIPLGRSNLEESEAILLLRSIRV